MIIGKQSIQFDRAPYILEASSVVGKKREKDLWESYLTE